MACSTEKGRGFAGHQSACSATPGDWSEDAPHEALGCYTSLPEGRPIWDLYGGAMPALPSLDGCSCPVPSTRNGLQGAVGQERQRTALDQLCAGSISKELFIS